MEYLTYLLICLDDLSPEFQFDLLSVKLGHAVAVNPDMKSLKGIQCNVWNGQKFSGSFERMRNEQVEFSYVTLNLYR